MQYVGVSADLVPRRLALLAPLSGEATALQSLCDRAGCDEIRVGRGIAALTDVRYLPLAAAVGAWPPDDEPLTVAGWLADRLGSDLLVIHDPHLADRDTWSALGHLGHETALVCVFRTADAASCGALAELRAAGFRVVCARELNSGASDSVLTARGRQVLALVASGMTTAKISLTLGISPCTVESHIADAMNRLGANTRHQAALMAVSHAA